MDAGRYFEANPGDWIQLDRLANDTIFLNIGEASWVNLTMSGARAKLNTRIDTCVTFPNLKRTQRLFSCQSYAPMSSNQYPKESSVAERHLSTHFELQKAIPSDLNLNEKLEIWKRPFEPGFLVQLGQKGQNPIDTDFIFRFSRKSRLKMCTNSYSSDFSSGVNDVSFSYQLDTENLSYEMGLSTANELFARGVRLMTPTVSLAGEIYSHHRPAPSGSIDPVTGKKAAGRSIFKGTVAMRYSTLSADCQLSPTSPIPYPVEIVAYTTLGQHYGVSAACKMLDNRLTFAVNWKRAWSFSRQKIYAGLRYKFNLGEVPAMVKITASSEAGFAALFGIRLDGTVGIGVGASVNPMTSKANAALFFDV